jgi:site-specific recombinase XerD
MGERETMLLREAMQGYMMDGQIERQSASGLKLKRERLDVFISWCEAQGITTLDGVTPNIARAFVLHLQQRETAYQRRAKRTPLAPATIQGYVRVVRAFFHWCQHEGLLARGEEPTARVPRIKVPKDVIPTFTAEQMDAMLKVCDRATARGFRDYTILLVLMDTGIRASELVGLTVDDAHENYITVRGKGDKEREVGLGPTAAKAVWKYIHQYRKPRNEHEHHVFLGRGGKRLSYMRLWELVVEIGQRAGVVHDDMRPHTFRHTFAFSWLANGGDVFKLSRVLGHTEIQTTQIYLRAFQSREARVDHAQFSPVEAMRLGKQLNKKLIATKSS